MSTFGVRKSASPFLVALSAWLVPGAGYFLLGQRTRAVTVGVAILLLFLLGLLIGDIRVMDPPGWNDNGYLSQIVVRYEQSLDQTYQMTQRIEPTSLEQQQDLMSDDSSADRGENRGRRRDRYLGPAIRVQPFSELGEKPWFVGQVLCGPITLAAAAFSVHEARRLEPGDAGGAPVHVVPISHARNWEIGALYTAVAGMLNLLSLVDATFRAVQPEERPAAVPARMAAAGAQSETR